MSAIDAVQNLIEGLMSPRIGESLTQSYKKAKLKVKVTDGINKVDKDIDAIGKSLLKSSNRPSYPELTPAPPFRDLTKGRGSSGGSGGGRT
jgi:hypothetical protein